MHSFGTFKSYLNIRPNCLACIFSNSHGTIYSTNTDYATDPSEDPEFTNFEDWFNDFKNKRNGK